MLLLSFLLIDGEPMRVIYSLVNTVMRVVDHLGLVQRGRIGSRNDNLGDINRITGIAGRAEGYGPASTHVDRPSVRRAAGERVANIVDQQNTGAVVASI